MKTTGSLTSKESFAILHEIENMKYPAECGIKYSDWREQRIKKRMKQLRILFLKLDLAAQYAITLINVQPQ